MTKQNECFQFQSGVSWIWRTNRSYLVDFSAVQCGNVHSRYRISAQHIFNVLQLRIIGILVASTVSAGDLFCCDINNTRMALCCCTFTSAVLRHTYNSEKIPAIRILGCNIGCNRAPADGLDRLELFWQIDNRTAEHCPLQCVHIARARFVWHWAMDILLCEWFLELQHHMGFGIGCSTNFARLLFGCTGENYTNSLSTLLSEHGATLFVAADFYDSTAQRGTISLSNLSNDFAMWRNRRWCHTKIILPLVRCHTTISTRLALPWSHHVDFRHDNDSTITTGPITGWCSLLQLPCPNGHSNGIEYIQFGAQAYVKCPV